MVTFSIKSRTELEGLGLIIFQYSNRWTIVKKTWIAGNSLLNYTSIPIVTLNDKGEPVSELTSDCPIMQLWFKESEYVLICWGWVPGPGPGDFEKSFPKEEQVMEFIKSYYFGQNEYFNARKKYHGQHGL